MTRLALRIYDYLSHHKAMGLCLLLAVTAAATALVARLGYNEDITDFLPLDDNSHKALAIYQDISGANNIIAIVQPADSTMADPDMLSQAVAALAQAIEDADTAHLAGTIVAQVDMDRISEITDFVFSNIPYFLTPDDYARIDSALASPDFITRQLQSDKALLMLPSGGILSQNIGRDPLNLFSPTAERLTQSRSGLKYETYDGFIFSPDMSRAFAIVTSPYGSSETEMNSSLAAILSGCAAQVEDDFPSVDIHLTGGPIIAVGNASQIKRDTVVSVAIAIILILAMLLVTLRKTRNLLLIVLSIGWGWLFAMAALSLLHDKVSIIVIGISSVILGIAVNYPLHYIAHLGHTTDRRRALSEIVAPLVVGNITTVGAFLTLVPLQSAALRDLGLFASFLLIGTILFSIICLPHIAKPSQAKDGNSPLDKLCDVTLHNKPAIVWMVVALTVIFGYFSLSTQFDSNMAHINYMTPQQRDDMDYLSSHMTDARGGNTVFAVASGASLDQALERGEALLPLLDSMKNSDIIESYTSCHQFICSQAEQRRRIEAWNGFVSRHSDLPARLQAQGAALGFASGSFSQFSDIFSGVYEPREAGYFGALAESALASNFSHDTARGEYNVISLLNVPRKSDVAAVESQLDRNGTFGFDIEGVSGVIASHLSDNFNYIGWACGCIVFLFLWLSLGSVELATLSFVPMAVSWLWILGIMSLLGIQFNIVNVILATFIFGQGDDYTIFMTEGGCYEYAYRRRMLPAYKRSIIISAAIMFIGIGTLIIAKHPALRSLAQVTITGMFSVVLMAALFPPLIFNFLIKSGGKYRVRPLRLGPLAATGFSALVLLIQLAAKYTLGLILFKALKPTPAKRLFFRRRVQRLCAFDLKHMPGVRYNVVNEPGEKFDKPAVVVFNRRSALDAAILMALSPKLVLVSNGEPPGNPMVNSILRWMGNIRHPASGTDEADSCGQYAKLGYSVAIFPERKLSGDLSADTLHKGLLLADRLQLDIVPVVIHGADAVLPSDSLCVFPGTVTVTIGKRVGHTDGSLGTGPSARANAVRQSCADTYSRIASQIETAAYFSPLVVDRYRYKGVEVINSVKRNLRLHRDYSRWIDSAPTGKTVAAITGCGHGEFALLFALVHPSCQVVAVCDDTYSALLLRFSAQGVADNLDVATASEAQQKLAKLPVSDVIVYALSHTLPSLSRYETIKVDR